MKHFSLKRRKPMRSRNFRISGGLILAAISMLAVAGTIATVHGAPPAKVDASVTTDRDQSDLSVTVYNSDVALVRDVRQIHLQPGTFPLKFEDVASSINPVTVHFRSLTDPSKLSVIEQNYEYDLLDPQK